MSEQELKPCKTCGTWYKFDNGVISHEDALQARLDKAMEALKRIQRQYQYSIDFFGNINSMVSVISAISGIVEETLAELEADDGA